MDGLIQEKKAFRKALRQRIAAQDEKELEKSNEAIYNNMLALPELSEAETVFLYYSSGREVDTRKLIRFLRSSGKRVALPVSLDQGEMYFAICGETLREGRFPGIPEPEADAEVAEPREGSLIVVPGLSFDRSGYRMGQGGGYYDRYLGRHRLFSVGLAREALLFDSVPREEHDRPVNCLVTDAGVYRF